MPRRTWEFILDGKPHTVEMDHGLLSGRASLRLDGASIDAQAQKLDFGDCGFAYQFDVNGHICQALVSVNRKWLSYDFLVDGRSIETGKSTGAVN